MLYLAKNVSNASDTHNGSMTKECYSFIKNSKIVCFLKINFQCVFKFESDIFTFDVELCKLHRKHRIFFMGS